MTDIYFKITSNDREKNTFTPREKLPAKRIPQSKSPYEIVKKGERGCWIHLPPKSGKYQNLHPFNRLRFKQVSTVLHLHTF